MSSRINTNTTAIMASRNLNVNSDHEGKDIERLSTGLRINSAADDAAGLVISQNMNAQLVGLQAATSNTADAINEVKTAENALGEVQSLLMSMRQLAVNASNQGVNDSTDVAADQAQITSAISSINRISANTQFATKKLLDGSASGAFTTTSGSSLAGGSGLSIEAQGRWSTGNAYNYEHVEVLTATPTVATATGVTASSKLTGKLIMNGIAYELDNDNLASLNDKIQTSGYMAKIDGSNLTFTSLTTGIPAVKQVISTNEIQTAEGKYLSASTITQGTSPQMSLKDTSGHNLTSISTIDNTDGTSTYVFNNGLIIQATNKPGQISGASISSVAGKSFRGENLKFQIGANQGQTTIVGIPSVAADQIGLGAGSYADQNGTSVQNDTDSVADINVMTFKGAQDAMVVIDKAIGDISALRAKLGAFQMNVLESNSNSLNVASQNLSSSKSTITDADLATTVVQYTKDSILSQSATSALSYANQMPQQVLKLLQNA